MSSNIIYHQKAILVENVVRSVAKYMAQSLLDIGAGSPESALPISRSVKRYLAIEQDADSVRKLRSADLEVIHGVFPLSVDANFDVVLSSHSIPERSLDSYPSFLSKAWELTKPGGQFLIVTFKGGLSNLEEIRTALFGSTISNRLEFDTVVSFLETRGELHIEEVNSYIEAKSDRVMADFLGPWISVAGKELSAVMPHLLHVLNTRYKVRDDLFVFPTEHTFITCKKRN